MATKLSLGDLTVTSFETNSSAMSLALPAGESFPGMCSCIGICQPTEDINCLTSVPTQPTLAEPALA
ncbi:MAG TPA: hypothetical protein VE913_24730 [Longimicrobium sp.]|nr:hypothetical protein [Longimicrobium sp.]